MSFYLDLIHPERRRESDTVRIDPVVEDVAETSITSCGQGLGDAQTACPYLKYGSQSVHISTRRQHRRPEQQANVDGYPFIDPSTRGTRSLFDFDIEPATDDRARNVCMALRMLCG